ncbi:MAG: protein phosphatase 2C domain-containing protein [Lachnospiraceae bacterium]|nr:protein phosphatase 2C domain-containing protein [Lachnospiraceae bacterium]
MKLDHFAGVCYKPLGDKGEDAFAYDLSRSDVNALAVFDGCGGAGAWKYPEFKNATGAFVAAQKMSESFSDWAAELKPEDIRNREHLETEFYGITLKTLQALKRSCAPMGVAGSLVKSFPCTVSAAFVTPDAEDSAILTILNAGDSRVYILVPERGLIQITKDDSRGGPDPLESLRDNAPISNLLNADKPFKIRTRQIRIYMPCAVICATDGVFGYVRSPMDFEYLLLKAVDDAGTAAELEEKLEDTVKKITGDDSTCLMAFYGWGSWDDIKKSLKGRLDEVSGMVREMDRDWDSGNGEGTVRRIWDEYKKTTVYDELKTN